MVFLFVFRQFEIASTAVVSIQRTGKGCSVYELVAATEKVVGKTVNRNDGPRRAGDPATLTASNERAKALLGWIEKETVEDMIASTWKAYQ